MLDRLQDAVLAGDVGADEHGAAAQFISQCLALVVGEIGDHHAEAVVMQAPHGRLTQTSRAAADDGRRAVESL